MAEQKNVGEVQQIYLNHYYVLEANQRTDAETFLQKAYDAMMNQVNRLVNAEEQQIFLEKVKANQEINALMKEIHGTD